MRWPIGLLALTAVASGCLPGEELEKGRILDRVVCRGNERQSYALYIPVAYAPSRPTAILYCLDPGARGRIPVERFAKAAEAAGWIVAGSNNSRNGDTQAAQQGIEWMVRDTQERFTIDISRLYVAGFSGGARLALAWARTGQIAGVVASGAAFGGEIPKGVAFRVFGTAGVDDFNHDEVYEMCRELSRRGAPQHFAEFAGGHDWLPESLTGPAIEFLSGRSAGDAPPPLSSDQKKTAQRYAYLRQSIWQGDRTTQESLIGGLRRDENLLEDGVNRRVARRVLTGTYIGAMEQGMENLAAKSYVTAAQSFALAALTRPESAEAYYGLASAVAANRQTGRAVEAMERAVANGFRNRERVERDPLFDGVRKDARFAALVEKIGK